jgi:glucose-6-phosphate 1-dehydrogenase
MHGETELFARQDGVEAEWRVVDPVVGEEVTPLYEYDPGSWGPEEARQLVPDGGWSDPAPAAASPEATGTDA